MPRPFAALRDSFLDAYAALTGWTADERLDYFFAYTCLKIAWQISNGYGPYPRPKGKERHRQLRQVLRQGLEAASLNPATPLIGVSTSPAVVFNPVGSAA
jgi:hypothetical protein